MVHPEIRAVFASLFNGLFVSNPSVERDQIAPWPLSDFLRSEKNARVILLCHNRESIAFPSTWRTGGADDRMIARG
jgi:hypothetical protein